MALQFNSQSSFQFVYIKICFTSEPFWNYLELKTPDIEIAQHKIITTCLLLSICQKFLFLTSLPSTFTYILLCRHKAISNLSIQTWVLISNSCSWHSVVEAFVCVWKGESDIRKLRNEELHYLYCTAKRWMRLAVHVTRVGGDWNISRGFDTETRNIDIGVDLLLNES
jgi:hypothetical protein